MKLKEIKYRNQLINHIHNSTCEKISIQISDSVYNIIHNRIFYYIRNKICTTTWNQFHEITFR